MRAVTKHQPNILVTVKNGLDRLHNSLDVVRGMRFVWRESKRHNFQHMDTQAPPAQSCPIGQTTQKRATANPPTAAQDEKRKKDGTEQQIGGR